MSSGPEQIAGALDAGLRAAQQSLCQVHRVPMRDEGLSLHLAAFAAVCYGIQAASERFVDVDDVQPHVEKGLRHLCSTWDERPTVRRASSWLWKLRYLGDDPSDALALQSTETVCVAIPGVSSPAIGERGNYAVSRYRRYLGGVYIFSCDERRPNTWDEAGGEAALERALFRDVFGLSSRPAPRPGVGVFSAVLRTYRCAAVGTTPECRNPSRPGELEAPLFS